MRAKLENTGKCNENVSKIVTKNKAYTFIELFDFKPLFRISAKTCTRSQLWFPKESWFPKVVTNIYIYEGKSAETKVFHRPRIKSIHLKLLCDDIVILFHVKGGLRIFVLENCLWGFYFCESKGIVGVESASYAGWSVEVILHESFKMNCCSFKEELFVDVVKKLHLRPSHFESNCLLYVAIKANCIPGANVTGYLLSFKVWSGRFNVSGDSIFLKYMTIPNLSS